MLSKPKTPIHWIVLTVLAYMAVSFSVFQYNNPLANRMSFYCNFVDVMCWRTLPEYQIK